MRDEFHFSDIHLSMNAMGLKQSKVRPTYFACDPVRSYFDECQKSEIYFLNDTTYMFSIT